MICYAFSMLYALPKSADQNRISTPGFPQQKKLFWNAGSWSLSVKKNDLRITMAERKSLQKPIPINKIGSPKLKMNWHSMPFYAQESNRSRLLIITISQKGVKGRAGKGFRARKIIFSAYTFSGFWHTSLGSSKRMYTSAYAASHISWMLSTYPFFSHFIPYAERNS